MAWAPRAVSLGIGQKTLCRFRLLPPPVPVTAQILTVAAQVLSLGFKETE
jgi:hypothetical protein